MIIKHYEHSGLHAHIVIDGDLLIITSRVAVLRLNLHHGQGDDETVRWLRAPATDLQTWHTYALGKAEPELQNVFDAMAWLTFCAQNGIDNDDCITARRAAHRDYRSWDDACGDCLSEAQRKLVDTYPGGFWRLPANEVALLDAARAFAVLYTPKPELTIEQVATAAYMAMDASNLSGLVLSWAEWMRVINAHAQVIGIAQNEHDINRIMVDKLRELSGANMVTVSVAMRVVAEMAKRT